MKNHQKAFYWVGAILLCIILLVLLTIANYQFAKNNPGGTDFLVHWVGTRAYFSEGSSPYSDQVALEIQDMVYGRAALPGEHELRVAYPFYSVILFFPFAIIQDFNVARAVWMTILEIGLIALSLVSIQLTTWRPKFWVLVLLILFSLFWYHALRSLINGNVVILIALGIAGAFYAIKNKFDEFAGVLLALTTIKPQVVVLVVIYVLIWAGFHRRVSNHCLVLYHSCSACSECISAHPGLDRTEPARSYALPGIQSSGHPLISTSHMVPSGGTQAGHTSIPCCYRDHAY